VQCTRFSGAAWAHNATHGPASSRWCGGEGGGCVALRSRARGCRMTLRAGTVETRRSVHA
jgi:hypothetical protein